jgi:hypothetical protein
MTTNSTAASKMGPTKILAAIRGNASRAIIPVQSCDKQYMRPDHATVLQKMELENLERAHAKSTKTRGTMKINPRKTPIIACVTISGLIGPPGCGSVIAWLNQSKLTAAYTPDNIVVTVRSVSKIESTMFLNSDEADLTSLSNSNVSFLTIH